MKDEIKNGIIILVVVLVILGVVYFATAYKTGQINHKKYDSESSVTNNDPTFSNMIILSKVFNQKEEEYKVLFFSNKEIKDSLLKTVEVYDQNTDNIKLYKVNTDEAINESVLSDSENKNATTGEELKIKGTTLITVKKGKIVDFISNTDDILNSLE